VGGHSLKEKGKNIIKFKIIKSFTILHPKKMFTPKKTIYIC
jgi:hypothetical protein